MVSGINFSSDETSFDCEVCHTGKICQVPYKSSSRRAKEKLGLVHLDICGPINTTSLGGSKYFATFIDDYTRYTEVVMLKNRSEVLSAFKKYMLRARRESGHNIKILRTDNAKEYTSTEFNKLLESEGIKHELTVSHTPQQNGVAERANRTLVEMARCMLLQSKLPNSLWAEAINIANFIRNRCPTKALNNEIPFEMWNNRKPYVGFMRTFGCKAVTLIKGVNRGKFEAKGKLMTMVGYSSESKAYRLWQPGTKKIIKSRDVRFIEEENSDERTTELFKAPLKLNEEDVNEHDDAKSETKTENETAVINNENATDPHDDGIWNTPKGIINIEENDTIEEDPSPDDILEPSISMKNADNNEEVKRGRGRPKKIKTGKPGRPKLLYQEANCSIDRYEDPSDVEEMLSRTDKRF